MELWQAVVLGLVEGITEYLPVSSTGHLILASALMKMDTAALKPAVDAFEVVIQMGAILAVVGLYWGRFVQMLRGVMGKDAAGLRLLINLVIAFLPAAVIGLVLHKTIKHYLFGPVPVAAALLAGGVYMIGVDRWKRAVPESGGSIEELKPGGAFLIGLLQCVAMWPGMSRSMMTITGGYFAKLRVGAAAEFSFLLGVPTLLAAGGLDLAKDLWGAHKNGTQNMFQVLGPVTCVVGLVVAAVSAAIAVKWLVGFLVRRGLAPFGVYRIAVGVVMLVLIWRGVVTSHS